jgi:glycolate oxidase iron-sulfur subunit
MGVEVVLPLGAGCCGSLAHHIGQRGNAMGFARANVEAWSREIAQGGLDAIVVNASGCGTTIKDYGLMFREDPLAAQAAEVSKRAVDISELLTRLGYAPTRRAEGVTIAYHAACSLQHGQKIVAEPKALLRAAGFRIVEPRDPHLCCGSAGTYNILEPEIAARLRARKLETLKAVRPDAIAAGNIGCLTQLAGEGVPTVHSVALLDWAMGGPVPDGMESLLPG